MVNPERAAAGPAERSSDGLVGPSAVVVTADVPVTEVAPGIRKRVLPETANLTAWIIDFDAGSRWPHVDVHTSEERYFVLSGELHDNGLVHLAGTYVVFGAGSSHRPSTPTGASILGSNVVAPATTEPDS